MKLLKGPRKGFNYFGGGYLHPPNKNDPTPQNLFLLFLFKTQNNSNGGGVRIFPLPSQMPYRLPGPLVFNILLNILFRMVLDIVEGYVINSTIPWCADFARTEPAYFNLLKKKQTNSLD